MKTKINNLLLLTFILSLAASSVVTAGDQKQKTKDKKSPKKGTIELFNGKDLSNWAFKLKDPAVDPANVFTVQNGVIHIKGDPFGYMRTKEAYSDYKLHVEWRWPAEPTNSGVFLHGQKPDTIWLRCVECQLKAGNAGDFVCMNGADMNERGDKAKIVVSKKSQSSEKPAGEWNTMEVTCKDNTVEVYINGVLQNKGTGLNVKSGFICLQSEGKDIEFRNVYLEKLKK